MARRRTAHAMAYVTAPDRESASRIARGILERRLAACANMWPIGSVYWWKGDLRESKEVVIVFKTRRALVRKFIAAVRSLHPYEVPCIVTYPMGAAFPAYLDWIDRETAQR